MVWRGPGRPKEASKIHHKNMIFNVLTLVIFMKPKTNDDLLPCVERSLRTGVVKP